MDETGHRQFTQAEPREVGQADAADTLHHIGFVMDIAGSSSQITLDAGILTKLMSHGDPSIAMAGQVGSQIKIRIGHNWLLASIRTQRMHDRDHGIIMAQVDFLGEGDGDRVTGKISNFRRGVTRYPIPGSEVYAVSSADMNQVYATDARAHVEIGTVVPTKDIRGALYVDALLGKHFALVGSTGTGKSTCAALIVHKMCDIAPDGHIVMIDPHGEYSAAFKQNGALFDVNNLAMPYWMMNFAEHCEVFVTSTGDDRQIDSDILARCLLQARAKNRIAENIGKLTVDAPIPYLLSDLTNILQNEMGKLDKATSSAPFMRLKSKIDELKADPRYKDNNARVSLRAELLPELRRRLATLTAAELTAIFEKAGLPFAPIVKPEELFDDPHLNATGGLADVRLSDGPKAGQTARAALFPFTMDGQRLGVRHQPPHQGENTDELLQALGLSAADIAQLRALKAVA